MSTDNHKPLLFMMYLVGLVIIFYNDQLSFLDKKFVERYNITYWHVSHFVFYFIIGSLCPNRLYLFMLMGIFW